MSGHGGAGGTGERAVPYLCPFCGEENLRPVEGGRWSCRSCCRVFSVSFHGLQPPARPPGLPSGQTPSSVPATAVPGSES